MRLGGTRQGLICAGRRFESFKGAMHQKYKGGSEWANVAREQALGADAAQLLAAGRGASSQDVAVPGGAWTPYKPAQTEPCRPHSMSS